MTKDTHFDWIDGLLFAAGFVSYIGILIAAQQMFGFEVPEHPAYGTGGLGVVFVFYTLRRKIFGAPQHLPPRKGAAWSLISILGLFCILSGTFAWAMAASQVTHIFEEPPDFEAVGDELDSKASDFAVMFNDADAFMAMPMPNETKEEHAARITREAEEEEAQTKKQRDRRIRMVKEDWQTSKKEAHSSFFSIGKYAFLLTGIGAFCVRIRYPFRPKD
jgi:hypothetical protein